MNAAVEIQTHASLNARPIALARATWEIEETARGRAVRPVKATWTVQKIRGAIVPLIGCPNCGGLTMLVTRDMVEKGVVTGVGARKVHEIDRYGKVTPDVKCMGGTSPGGPCDFHRTVYLDKWNRLKPLYAVAYTKPGSLKIEIAYCHASNQREARIHLGHEKIRLIAIGPAVGFFVDEATGKVTTS